MTTPPSGPRDDGTPADAAEGSMGQDQYLGRDSGADLEADGGAGSGDGTDPTTETDEDPRFA